MSETIPTYDLKLTVQQFVPVMKRDRQALILVANPTKTTFTLGRKHAYPEGISRLVGGGIEPGENPQDGAARELAEELSIAVTPDQLTPLALIKAQITSQHENKTLIFQIFLFSFTVMSDQLAASDDLDELLELDASEFESLINHYSQLSPLPTELGFNWYDYGQLYGPVHRIAVQELLNHKK